MNNGITHIVVPLYKPDGFGRDNYARIDNGGNTMFNYPTARGFSDGRVPTHKFKTGVGVHSQGSKHLFMQEMNMHSPGGDKRFKYRQDGSGRDTYILNNNGGLYPDKELAPYKETFQEKLRGEQLSARETTYEY